VNWFFGLLPWREQRGSRGLAFDERFFEVLGVLLELVQRAQRVGEAGFGLADVGVFVSGFAGGCLLDPESSSGRR